ncbi:DJ-1/PfpI family protein [Amycolatopsis taiwanensis]|uniref:Glutamine amidotransferase n=1 Tax=Amycolatopsis taiwanensis TaxID=342230 RepID=A0A9W6R5N0_9PSEU|nr:glutamine amidotransferase [Amycolatopsis taiwanensis]
MVTSVGVTTNEEGLIRLLAQIVLFDGFDPLDAIAPYEVLAAGGAITDGTLEAELVSAEGPRQVPSGMSLLSLAATARLEPQRADLIVVPGAAGSFPTGEDDVRDDSIPGILARTLDTPLPGLLKQALDRPGLTVATVCGGSLVLAMAGLITGRPATTHHLGLDGLAATGVVAIDARVVDDGDLVTASSVTSGLDLGLYLLERELGPRVAHAAERLFAHERRGIVWRDTGLAPTVNG